MWTQRNIIGRDRFSRDRFSRDRFSTDRPGSGSFAVEALEGRALLSAPAGAPTAAEQYLLELINRARAHPVAEAARYGIELNEGLAGGTLSSAARQPLALNPLLIEAARGHVAYMLEHDLFAHEGAGGSGPGERMTEAGYAGAALWAENLAWAGWATFQPTAEELAEELHRRLFVDEGIARRGHRVNMLDGHMGEIGIGLGEGTFQGFGSVAGVMDFAKAGGVAGGAFLTGVAYRDQVRDDHFYTPGEGVGGVVVTATRALDGAIFTTTTWDSGGYSLALPVGTYVVSIDGGGLAETGIPAAGDGTTVTIGAGLENVKLDFTPGVWPPIGGGQGPEAELESRKKVAAGKNHVFRVTYRDETGMDMGEIGTGDVRVTSIKGFNRTAHMVLKQERPDGSVVVTYRVAGPGGAWDWADNGKYVVRTLDGEVCDEQGNAMGAEKVGVFVVRIPRKAAPSSGKSASGAKAKDMLSHAQPSATSATSATTGAAAHSTAGLGSLFSTGRKVSVEEAEVFDRWLGTDRA